jgi:hypothetical protein
MFTQNRRQKKFIFIGLGFSISRMRPSIGPFMFMHNTGRITSLAMIHA